MNDPDKDVPVDVRIMRGLEAGTLPKECLLVGPAGTGKTRGILNALHCILADYPGLRFLLCRQTRTSLTESVLVTYEKEVLVADGMESLARGPARAHRRSYDYPNGSTLVLGGLEHPDRILSTAWDLIYINEAIEATEEYWDALWGRLNRPGRPPWLGFLLGDTNPGDPSHWLKRRAEEGRTAFWDTGHRANPGMWDADLGVWTAAGRLYLAGLEKYRGTRRKRFLEGIWAAGEGQWFETFTDANVTHEAEFDPAHPVHLAVDSGVHTGAVWFQVKGQGDAATVNVFGDLYLNGRSAYDAGKAILARTGELSLPRVDFATTDPAGNASTGVGPTVMGEYRRAGLGLHPWPSFPGSLADGLALVDSFVSVDPPGLTVHPRCTRLIEAFANYKRAKRGGQFVDKPEDPQHPYEDLLDALRGGLMAKFPRGRSVKPTRRVAGGAGHEELDRARI